MKKWYNIVVNSQRKKENKDNDSLLKYERGRKYRANLILKQHRSGCASPSLSAFLILMRTGSCSDLELEWQPASCVIFLSSFSSSAGLQPCTEPHSAFSLGAGHLNPGPQDCAASSPTRSFSPSLVDLSSTEHWWDLLSVPLHMFTFAGLIQTPPLEDLRSHKKVRQPLHCAPRTA